MSLSSYQKEFLTDLIAIPSVGGEPEEPGGEVDHIAGLVAPEAVVPFIHLHGWMAVVVKNTVSHTVVFDGEAIVFRGLTGCHLRFDLSE